MSKIGSGFQVGLSWVPMQDKNLPHGAIQVDKDIYVARAIFNGEKIPGKYHSHYNVCYIPYGGKEHQVKQCEILCDTSIHGDDSWYEPQVIFTFNIIHL